MPRRVYFIEAGMPSGLSASICDALCAEGHMPTPLGTLDDALEVLRREMVTSGLRYCVVRNPATSEDDSRMWGFIMSNSDDFMAMFSEEMSGSDYCVMEFWFTADEAEASREVKPAPVYKLREGCEIPADRSISWSMLVKQ